MHVRAYERARGVCVCDGGGLGSVVCRATVDLIYDRAPRSLRTLPDVRPHYPLATTCETIQTLLPDPKVTFPPI